MEKYNHYELSLPIRLVRVTPLCAFGLAILWCCTGSTKDLLQLGATEGSELGRTEEPILRYFDTSSSCKALEDDLLAVTRRLVRSTESSDHFGSGYATSEVREMNTIAGLSRKIHKRTNARKKVGKSKSDREFNVDGPFGAGGLVQRDGQQIFIARGDEILAVDIKTMVQLSNTKLPPLDETCITQIISSMLLVEDRLVVLGMVLCEGLTDDAFFTDDPPVIMDDDIPDRVQTFPAQTSVHIYRTNDMTLIESMALPGLMSYVHAVDDVVHIFIPRRFRTDSFMPHASNNEFHQRDFVTKLLEQDIDCASWKNLHHQSHTFDDYATDSIHLLTITSFRILDDVESTVKTTSTIIPYGLYDIHVSGTYAIVSPFSHCRFYGVCKKSELMSPVLVYKMDGLSMDLWTVGAVLGMPTYATASTINGIDYLYVVASHLSADGYKLKSQISAFQLTEHKMKMVGHLGDLPGAFGAAIHIQKDRGFFSTGSMLLYTVDLSDPTKPQLAGKIHGKDKPFMTLSQIDDTHIVGIGIDGGSCHQDYVVALFDVANLYTPILVQQWTEPWANDKADISMVLLGPVQYIDEQMLLTAARSMIWMCDPDSDDGNDYDDDACHTLSTDDDGFRLFRMNSTGGMVEYFSIDHIVTDVDGCDESNPFGKLPLASFVMDLNTIVTVGGYSIQKHDLEFKTEIMPRVDVCNGTTYTKGRPFQGRLVKVS